jgi:hypothetical protein
MAVDSLFRLPHRQAPFTSQISPPKNKNPTAGVFQRWDPRIARYDSRVLAPGARRRTHTAGTTEASLLSLLDVRNHATKIPNEAIEVNVPITPANSATVSERAILRNSTQCSTGHVRQMPHTSKKSCGPKAESGTSPCPLGQSKPGPKVSSKGDLSDVVYFNLGAPQNKRFG